MKIEEVPIRELLSLLHATQRVLGPDATEVKSLQCELDRRVSLGTGEPVRPREDPEEVRSEYAERLSLLQGVLYGGGEIDLHMLVCGSETSRADEVYIGRYILTGITTDVPQSPYGYELVLKSTCPD